VVLFRMLLQVDDEPVFVIRAHGKAAIALDDFLDHGIRLLV
jgi:hypothetical protein